MSIFHILKDSENIAKVTATVVPNVNFKTEQCHSNLLNSSKITLDTVSTALVEKTFQGSANVAVNSAVAYPVSSDVDLALKFNLLAISTPEIHFHRQSTHQNPGTDIEKYCKRL